MLNAFIQLIFHGDYTPWFNTIGLAEDHPLIDLILTLNGF